MEIRKLQQSTKLLIPKLPFMRLVKEIMMGMSPFGKEPLRLVLSNPVLFTVSCLVGSLYDCNGGQIENIPGLL